MRLHDPDFCLQERLTLIHRRRREYVQEHILILSGTIDAARFVGFIFWFLIFLVIDVWLTSIAVELRIHILLPLGAESKVIVE